MWIGQRIRCRDPIATKGALCRGQIPPTARGVADLFRDRGECRRRVDARGERASVCGMPTAIVLLKIDHRKVTGTAEKLLEIRDITDVYSVSGRFDLLIVIKCDSLDKIESVITDELLKTEGITESETMFAFRSYDKREGGRAVDVD
jgi:DNA-binding Lrp family transcriptional regulator